MKRSWEEKAVLYITMACFVAMTMLPSTTYAQEPESTPTLTYESTLIPLPELKLRLDLPDFTFDSTTCSGCTVTPIPAGMYPGLGEGIFLNKESAAAFLAWQSFTQGRFDYELDYAMGRVRNADLLSIRMLEDQSRTRQQLDALRLTEVMAQRDFALTAAHRKWYEQPGFLIPVGVIAGIALTLATGAIIQETWNPN